MILKAICDARGPEFFEHFRQRYNQNDFYSSHVNGNIKNGYDGRYATSRYWNIKSFRRSEDDEGLVGLQEVSHY